MWPIPQEIVELEALNAELRAENAALHTALARARELNASLCFEWARPLEARVDELAKELEALKHRGGRKGPTLERQVEMMVRYVELGGRERGQGEAALTQVAKEYGVSVSMLKELVRKFKRMTVPVRKVQE